mmetsp:Transcript_22264/g.53933  ORF Transcript_22264/g.53933 Transcript_22264/m.53933 type:complete len:130 (+) Transcript_22264:188-577(+)
MCPAHCTSFDAGSRRTEFSPLNEIFVHNFEASSEICIMTISIDAWDDEIVLDKHSDEDNLTFIADIRSKMHFKVIKRAFRTRNDKLPPLILIEGLPSPEIQSERGMAATSDDVARSELGKAIQLFPSKL